MSAAPPPLITEEIVELMASGIDVYVATRDAELEPESMLGMGIRAHADRRSVTVYLPRALAEATCRNLEANGAIAMTITRPSDFRAVQLKGRSRGIRPCTEADRDFQAFFRSALVEQLEMVGVPRAASRRLVWWPSVAVEVEIDEVYGQTPGPTAGEPLRAP